MHDDHVPGWVRLGLVVTMAAPQLLIGLWALLAFVAFTVPHVAYHAWHPAAVLSGPEDVLNVVSLGSGLVLAAVFAYGSIDRPPQPRVGAGPQTRPREVARHG